MSKIVLTLSSFESNLVHKEKACRLLAQILSESLFPADGAVQSVKDGGLLLVTCTDMAVLCGKLVEKNRNFIHQELIL